MLDLFFFFLAATTARPLSVSVESTITLVLGAIPSIDGSGPSLPGGFNATWPNSDKCQYNFCSEPIAAIPAFIKEANEAVTKLIPGARPLPFGHVGDGNIHYNIAQPIGADTAEFMRREEDVHDAVFEVVAKHGGSISAEHGVGIVKRDRLPQVKDKVALELMRTLKRTLDPKGILNPGKVL